MNWKYGIVILVFAGLIGYLSVLDFQLIFHPEVYHGKGKDSNFFEGWYFKAMTKDESHFIIFIGGIFYGNQSHSPQSHSFVMAIWDGKHTAKYNYRIDEFIYDSEKFNVSIGANKLSQDELIIDLTPQPGGYGENLDIKGKLEFSNIVPWPITLSAPGVMGWYSYVPTLECWHGVVSMHHKVSGSITVNGVEYNFDDGKGYIEKDWGVSFPQNWIWLQNNHFPSYPDTSLFLSVASVPWKTYSFVGYLVGLYINQELLMFTTWNGANFKIISYDQNKAVFQISDNQYNLQVSLSNFNNYVLLHGPRPAGMTPFVKESYDCSLEIQLERKLDKSIVMSDSSHKTSCEVIGDIQWIINNQ